MNEIVRAIADGDPRAIELTSEVAELIQSGDITREQLVELVTRVRAGEAPGEQHKRYSTPNRRSG